MIDRTPALPYIGKEIKIPRWISIEDQKRIFEVVPAEDRPIIEFCMTYGCRPGEARALQIQDIDCAKETEGNLA
jgi:integrase